VARNVEIKARLSDPAAVRRRVVELAGGEPQVLQQTDTFFTVAGGRLKLREFSGEAAELIYYERADTPDPAESRYQKVDVAGGPALRALLEAALGVVGRVVKRREVFRVGRTRVHLDRVEGLGAFLELEVEMGEDEAAGAGVAEAQRLMRALGIGAERLVAEAYVDLLLAASRGQVTVK
jgi:predicted adenylyl cyclase CyaB